MLYLVGRNITAERARYRKKTAELEHLAHGVYCDAEDVRQDKPGFLRANAIRIANYLYPDAALVFASAYLKGPVEANNSTAVSPRMKLYVGGAHKTISVVGDILEIVHMDTLANSQVRRFCTDLSDGRDGELGRMTLACASDELVYLQSQGRYARKQPERFLPADTLIDLRERLEGVFGKELAARLSVIVQRTGEYGAELARVMDHLNTPLPQLRRRSAPANLSEFVLAWQRRPVARLSYNGVNWSFAYEPGWGVQLHTQRLTNQQIPAFVTNLLPEGSVRELLRNAMTSSASGTVLENSERYLSNLSIVRDPARLSQIPRDRLQGRLDDFRDAAGQFEGSVLGLPPHSARLLTQLADTLVSEALPRIPGMQPKILMNLSDEGELTPALAQAATHILKFPGLERDTRSIKGVVEWASMTLATGSGLPCADFALVCLEGQPDALAYVTERFDVPSSPDDLRLIYAEDLCAALGLAPDAKGLPTLNDVIDVVRKVSTNAERDMEDLYQQIVVNYLLENADFHTKNLSLLKVASPTLDGMRSVRMAPAYDIMRTAYFGNVKLEAGEREPMQLGFCDTSNEIVDREWSHEDFVEIGALCGLSSLRSMEILRSSAEGISTTAQETALRLPPALQMTHFSTQREIALDLFAHAVRHCHEFFPDLPATLDLSAADASARASAPLRASRP